MKPVKSQVRCESAKVETASASHGETHISLAPLIPLLPLVQGFPEDAQRSESFKHVWGSGLLLLSASVLCQNYWSSLQSGRTVRCSCGHCQEWQWQCVTVWQRVTV